VRITTVQEATPRRRANRLFCDAHHIQLSPNLQIRPAFTAAAAMVGSA
jgi:hypothetical protein